MEGVISIERSAKREIGYGAFRSTSHGARPIHLPICVAIAGAANLEAEAFRRRDLHHASGRHPLCGHEVDSELNCSPTNERVRLHDSRGEPTEHCERALLTQVRRLSPFAQPPSIGTALLQRPRVVGIVFRQGPRRVVDQQAQFVAGPGPQSCSRRHDQGTRARPQLASGTPGSHWSRYTAHGRCVGRTSRDDGETVGRCDRQAARHRRSRSACCSRRELDVHLVALLRVPRAVPRDRAGAPGHGFRGEVVAAEAAVRGPEEGGEVVGGLAGMGPDLCCEGLAEKALRWNPQA
mmetsp:Transcript_37144/g.97825  ORF Transcript_37144/g.97825 Transcript_37144/m.97825 type:complete len:293 (+) Transcript_37144:1278-2156(+)